ncbi:hypothetical protein I546_2682 [Mycobacterium kansasii 732]|nr:hypothetical protein I546_2682 [Mycobacterium kansasii 732]
MGGHGWNSCVGQGNVDPASAFSALAAYHGWYAAWVVGLL